MDAPVLGRLRDQKLVDINEGTGREISVGIDNGTRQKQAYPVSLTIFFRCGNAYTQHTVDTLHFFVVLLTNNRVVVRPMTSHNHLCSLRTPLPAGSVLFRHRSPFQVYDGSRPGGTWDGCECC